MKVLVFNRISDTTEVNLYLNLKRRGVDLHLVLDPADPGYEKYKELGIPYYKQKVANRFDISAIKLINKLQKQEKFDIIYAPASRNLSTTLFATFTQPVKIVTYRGTIGRLSLFSPLSWLGHLNPRVNAIVCNCEAVKKNLLELGVKSDKLPVIYKGHEREWYQNAEEVAFETPSDKIIFSCVANVRKKKGINVLIQAVNKLPSDLKFCLFIAGNIDQPEIVDEVEKLGLSDRVKFLGFIKSPGSLLAKSDFLVVPSLEREGVPRSMMEAMSLGVPAIATRVGGIPEILSDQHNGILLNPGDVQSLTGSIERLCYDSNLRSLMGRNAAERIKTSFNSDLHSGNFLSLFNRILS